MNNKNFTDKEILDDVLSSQKFVTDTYNTFASECASAALKSEFMNILAEEHQIQHDIFLEMQSRGWYVTQPAQQEMVSQAKQKFTNSNPASSNS